MPRYILTGIGRETGRKRKKTYTADSLEAAYKMASLDGTIVDSSLTESLPDPLATEPQKEYADHLGISYDENTTLVEMSNMLDAFLHKEGHYYDSVLRTLKESHQTGEVIDIIYLGGTQPGTRRSIFPLTIEPPYFEAKCLSSGQTKTFVLHKVQLPLKGREYPRYSRKRVATPTGIVFILKFIVYLIKKAVKSA